MAKKGIKGKTNQKRVKMQNHYLKKFLLLTISMFAMALSAQSFEVVGKVIEKETNSPLPGATILIKDSTFGVSSDFDGNFNHCIIIRSFMSKNQMLHYQAGAGVVSKSVPENELQEVYNKLGALDKSLNIAEKL